MGLQGRGEYDTAEAFVEFYKELFGTLKPVQCFDSTDVVNGHFLPIDRHEELLRDVSYEEIKAAIFGIQDTKALGSDGYSSSFFKKAWLIVGEEIFAVVADFFRSRKILGSINSSHFYCAQD